MSVFATSLALSMAISAESDLGTTRPCTTCSRRRLLNTDPYKRCGDCREKGRIRARETQKKKRDSIREGMIKEMGKIEKEEMQEKTEKTEKKRKRAEKQEDGKQPKKRAKQILNSVDVNRKNGVVRLLTTLLHTLLTVHFLISAKGQIQHARIPIGVRAVQVSPNRHFFESDIIQRQLLHRSGTRHHKRKARETGG